MAIIPCSGLVSTLGYTRVHGQGRILSDCMGQKNPHNMLNIMGKNFYWDLKNLYLVEAGGVEPPSANNPRKASTGLV